ncbi:hypothetical protein [Niallia nealsonii]|uniref:Uncharacterized protein n=1 Tax=Niallia nealsonii TaxID=115979 RepID=A0A2N0Z4F8_9BACI|nr:hypothetical protein [Niallia nealsonii]PKG24397.1 hypothetical protein CWS01_07235 [Niallia nealsonii]
MWFRFLPVLINVILYFGLDMSSALNYFYYTIPFLLFGKWHLVALGIYFYVQGNSAGVWIVAITLIFMLITRIKKKGKSAITGRETAATKQYKANKKKNNIGRDEEYYRSEEPTKRSSYSFNSEESRNDYSTEYYNYDNNQHEEELRDRKKAEDDEYWERKRKEDDAYYYRRNGGPRWKVDAADDDLGRSQFERNYEDDK